MPLLALLAAGFAMQQALGHVGLRMVYRFSEEAEQLGKARHLYSPALLSKSRATLGTPHFYEMLHRLDRRRLAAAYHASLPHAGTLSFSSGNITMNYGEDYGWLHYAMINIGAPNTSFLVALDTGSDLLWVPCECRQCASNSASSKQLEVPLNVYNPAESKTSQHVTCNNSLCGSQEICESKSDDCLYNVRYVSANTWTSGVLVEDIIYLSSGRDHNSSVEAQIVFGCGQVQSGNFLHSGAPDGLLGLGFGAIALPTTLTRLGLVKDSFSMCFESDGSGRIFFGDKGLPSQNTTPFLPLNGTHVRYVVGLESIVVGGNIQPLRIEIIVDSGTSFTYLPKKVYSGVTTQFDGQISQRRVVMSDVPWEFCYETSNDDVQAPALSMVFSGGGNFSVYNPLIGIYGENGSLDAFCLAVLESDIAILGQSFMTGYQLVFDREGMKLGWSPSDCYKLDEGMDMDAASPSTSLVAAGDTPFTTTRSHEDAQRPSLPNPVLAPSYSTGHRRSHTLLYSMLSFSVISQLFWRFF